MKWLLALLVLLGGGVAWAAFAVPTNAAVVNGSAISQASLNSDVNAIAGSSEYQCYLNSQAYLSSNGQSTLPPVAGAGKGQNEGDNPTANSAFVATYLDTVIGHELVDQLAAKRNVTVNAAQLADARSSLENQISAAMQQVAQTAQGQNPQFSCGAVSRPLTGQQVLGSVPSWFADQQVQFVATASALQEDLAGVGSSEANLQGYYEKHRAQFDTVCFNAAEYTDQASAQAAQAAVNFGTPFSQVAGSSTQSGTIPCTELVAVAGELGTSVSTLDSIAVGKASAPINVNGNYIVLELSQRAPTPYATAKRIVSQAVQEVGATATQSAITKAERRATVSVDPRYGTWVPVSASVFTPFTPEKSDLLNAPANQATASTSTSPFSG
ncbi:MAG TPA: peptidyl-prolyl cis-trans isomerase [Acidimicrobiales bacterium]|nr:peptidyl-prolyl cis-trans isomerase [Acidimicrobiales bacterium]